MNASIGTLGIRPMDAVAIVGYFALMGFFGYLTRRTKTFGEYATGKHSIPALMIFASLATTIVGPGFSIGFTTKGFLSGYLFYFLCISYALQTVVSGLLLAPKLTKHRDCHTLGDVMRKSYGPFAQLLTGLVSVGLLMGFTAIMGKIGGEMLQAITGWPLWGCLVIVTGTTTLLTFTGGLRATIATEAVQFSLKSLIVPAMLLLAVIKSPVPLSVHAAKAWELTAAGWSSMSGWALFGIIVSFLLGEVLLPPYANRALAAKTEEASVTGFLMAGGFTIVWLGIVGVLGVIAHAYLPANTPSETIFLAMGKHLLPVGIYGVLLAAVIAIVMSSQESVLNSGAVAFVRDVVHVFREVDDKTSLTLAKISTIAIAAVAIYVARYAPSIIDGLLILYSIWAPTILLPMLACLFDWKRTPTSGWLSILMGGGASLFWHAVLKEPHGFPSILVGLAAAGVGFGIGLMVPGKQLDSSAEVVR